MYFDIPGFDDYEISRIGEVRHKTRRKVLKTRSHPDGYLQFVLYCNKKPKTVGLHRLMALAFLPNPKNKPQVNHKNGVKVDNRICNLEWVTLSENRQHAYDFGLQKPHQVWRKLSPADVVEIKKTSAEFTRKELAQKYRVSLSLIGAILNNKRRNVGVNL